MRLLSLFKRQDDSSADATAPDAVASARTRARRRLIGATVLLGVGVLGFPLLFETQPRPIPVDIPIEIPRKEAAPPLPLPPARAPVAASAPVPRPSAPVLAAVPAAPPAASSSTVVTERAADAGRELAAPAAPAARAAASSSAPSASRAAAAAPAPRSSAPTATRVASAPTARAAAPAADDGQRARALLEGQPLAPESRPPNAADTRVVVQVGAYTDADKLREARQKVEKLGLKTYTQVIESGGSKRTRVRIGPFATREEADKAAARLKAAGLPVAILTL